MYVKYIYTIYILHIYYIYKRARLAKHETMCVFKITC